MNPPPTEPSRTPPAPRFRPLPALLLALFAAAPAARAAQPPDIVEVRFVYRDPATGREAPVDAPSPEWFAARTRLQPGRPFTPELADREQTRFITEHRLLCLEIRTEPVPGGVRVICVFERRAKVWDVRIVVPDGAPSVDAGDLIRRAVTLRRDDPVDASELEADRLGLARHLRSRGYHFASVVARMSAVPNRPDFRRVAFEVDRGPKVQPESISLAGNEAFSDDDLLDLMTTRVDRWYNSKLFVESVYREDLNRIRRHYLALGWEGTEVRDRPVLFDPDYVTVAVRWRREGGRNVVTDVEVDGVEAVDDDRVCERMLTRPGRTFSRERLERDLRWLEALYYRAGFRADPADRHVRYHAADGAGRARARLVFSRAREEVVLSVVVRRDPAGGRSVRAVEHRTTGPVTNDRIAELTRLRPGSPFTLDALYRDSMAVAEFYTRREPGRNYALLEARTERTPDGHVVRLAFMKKGSAAHLRIRIHEGTRYTVGAVSFEGVEPVLEDHLRDRIRLNPGDVFRRIDFAADIETIRTVFQEQGHADVRVNAAPPRIARRGERVFDLAYSVTPGPEYTVNLIRPRGNDRTRPDVIQREMAIQPGDRYDARKIEQSERRLKTLGYFQQVDIRPVDSPRREPGKRYKDLLVQIQEAATAHLMLGVGASSTAGVFGDLRYQDTNFDLGDPPRSWDDFVSGTAFAGGGQTLALFLQPGTEASNFGFRWHEPWLHQKPIELGVGASYTTQDWDEYELRKLGGQVSLGKRFRPDFKGFVGLRAHTADVDDVETTAAKEIWDDEGRHNVLGLFAGLTHDTIDRKHLPTEGAKTTLLAEIVGTPGPDALKLIAEGRWYWSVYEAADQSRQVLSLWARAGVLAAGSDLPVFERFYAGGLGSVRGFAARTISPRSRRRYINPNIPALGVIRVPTGDAVGGECKIEGGVEYHFPIVKDRWRGLVFLDAGSVGENPLGFGGALSDLRASVGIGTEFVLPQLGNVPFALYLALPLRKERGDDTETFSFSFGLLLY
jgi:outer membrane protein assembly complex protein YaeT